MLLQIIYKINNLKCRFLIILGSFSYSSLANEDGHLCFSAESGNNLYIGAEVSGWKELK
jgi:hypothetical protein